MGGRPVEYVLCERRLAKGILKSYGLGYYDPAESEGLENLAKDAIVDMKATRETMASYVRKDLRNLRKCDALLVLTGDKPSDGTWHEICFAKYKLSMPIALKAPKRHRGEIMGFTNIQTPNLFPTITDAVIHLQKIAKRRGHAVHRTAA